MNSSSRDHDPTADAATAPSAAAFTPGPWVLEVGDNTHRFVRISDEDGRTIFYKYGSGTKAEADVDAANAQLATLAPEFLDVVRDLLEHSVSHYGHPTDESYGVGRVHAWARAVIAKAEGRS